MEVDKGPRFGIRYVQAILCFSLIIYAYSTRVCLSVGIVAMTDSSTSSNPDVPTYGWNNKSVVLSSFYWGYVVLQIAAGQLVKKYGAKYLLVGSVLMNSLALMFIPFFAGLWGSRGVMACRMLQGLSQGFVYPSVSTLLGKWIPPNERSTVGTYVYSGASFGTIVAMPVTGAIAASWSGWPVAFYFFGGLGLVWLIPWILVGSNDPENCKWISEKEKKYVTQSLGVLEDKKELPTPWRPIVSSLPVWACTVAAFGHCWGYVTLLTEIPIYLNKIMLFDMENNGFLSAAPYLAQTLLSYCFGPTCDFLINKNYLTRTQARKVFQSIGVCVPAAALICLSFVPDEQTTLSVVLLITAVGTNAAIHCGFIVNTIDLAPNFSGPLMSIVNGSSNTFSIIAPLVVQAIVTDETDKSQWRIIFLVSSGLYVASATFFDVFASGEVQYWNEDLSKKKKDVEKSIEKY